MSLPELTSDEKEVEGKIWIMIKAGSIVLVGEPEDESDPDSDVINKTYFLTQDICVYVEEQKFKVKG